MYRVLGTTSTDKGMGISGGSRKCDNRKGRQAEKKRMSEDASLLVSPHIIVIVVIKLDIIAKGRVPILVMARVVSIAILVAVLTIPPLGLVAIVRIVVVVIHGGIIVCTVSVLLLLCLQ